MNLDDVLKNALREVLNEEVPRITENCLKDFFEKQKDTSPPKSNDIIFIERVKELTGLSSATIYSRVSKKTIPVQCRQRPLVFSEKHIRMWLQANRPKTDSIEEIEDILKQKAVNVNNES